MGEGDLWCGNACIKYLGVCVVSIGIGNVVHRMK